MATMTTETFAGGHGAPSPVAFYSPDQKRDPLGMWTKDDGGAEPMEWKKAIPMTEAQWGKLTDGQKAGLLAAVYAADASGENGAPAALAKLQGWVGKGKGGKGGGGGGKAKKSGGEKKSGGTAKSEPKRAGVRPDAVNSGHRDGYIVGESEDGNARMRWDKGNETYVVEKKDGKAWKEARRLKPAQAYNELAKATAKWYRPKVQPFLKPAGDTAKNAPKKKAATKSPDSRPGKQPGGKINSGRVDRSTAKSRPTTRGPQGKAKSDPITAAAEVHTGAMIALIPTEDRIKTLAMEGGEPPEQLHMTEIYLGDATDWSDEEREFVIDVISDFADSRGPVQGDAFSVNMFNPPGSVQADGKDRDSCVVLGIGGDDVADFHDSLREYLEDEGVEYPRQHTPRIPHVTLMYTDDADLSYFTDKTGPIVFDTIRVAFGGENYDIPLGGGEGDDEEVNDVTASSWSDDIIVFDAQGDPIVPNVLWDWRAFAKERDVNEKGGPGHNLRNYWLRGKGAGKIGWNTPGDFTRCAKLLAQYVKDPKGLCAEYHKQATGMWPGDKRNRAMCGDEEPFSGEMLYDGDGAETITAATKGEKVKSKPDEDQLEETPEVEETSEEVKTEPETNVLTAQNMQKPAAWEGVLTVEGIESGDGRMFGTNALTWDELPLPLRWQKESAHGGQNDVTVAVGNIEKIWREPAPDGRAGVNFIKGSGTIDLGNPDGAEVYRRMKRGYMRGNSVDVDSVKGADVELIFPESSGEKDEEGGDVQIFDMSRMQPELTVYKKGRIRATTLVEIPAFTEARLALTSDEKVTATEEPEAEDDMDGDEDKLVRAVNEKIETIVAAATTIEITDLPPREWFEEPKDVMPTGALTVTKEGRIYGYVAPLGVRHRSFQDKDVRVPMRKVDYSRFMGGETIVADGGRVSTGAITMNCGHASTSPHLTASQAAEHYDNTCSMVATVRVGENRHGVWMAGALLPDVTPEQIRRIMASRLSGDWRAHLDKPGWREFVAALLVPVPGFPMARTAPSVTASDGVIVASSVPVHFAVAEDIDETEETTSVETEAKTAATEDAPVTPKMKAAAVVDRVRAAKIQALRARIEPFHGTHNQKSHGNRDGKPSGGTSKVGGAKKATDIEWRPRKDGGGIKRNPATGGDHLVMPAEDGSGKWVHRYGNPNSGGTIGSRHKSKEDAMKDAERVIQRDIDSGRTPPKPKSTEEPKKPAGTLEEWKDFEAARDAVGEGEIFAQGKSDDGTYEARMRKHGKDAIAEVRMDGGDWEPVDSDEGDGVIDLQDLDPDVDWRAVGGGKSGGASHADLLKMKKADRIEAVKKLNADELATIRKQNMDKLKASRSKSGVLKPSEVAAAQHLDIILRQAQQAQGKKVNTAGLPKKTPPRRKS